ncbi:cyclin-K [Agrilus planipennis]|uniref:Cyclin-K n=1 Tax=Agrilus planipennis TaxID=224129 RepID=A0A1W4X4R1_AGRPL|nr:cyclin-K [Agrilus planipennis]
MPCWYYDKKELKNTPSALDGIDYETEMRYRKEGARFIIDTGSKMDLGYNTTATGVVYFHRFYMFHSFRQFPRYVTACCCLFLAGKVEETPKKCKDIIKTARSLLSDTKFATFGDDPKEEVMTLERILLQTIKFDLQVEHPYSYLLRYAKCLKGDKVKLQKMVQMAWTFVNDSLCTTLALQWEPEIIAVALMYLAGKLSQFEVIDWVGRTSKHLRWWDMFVEDVTMDLLEDICHQVLDLYSQPTPDPPPDSPPLMSKSASLVPVSGKSANGQEKDKIVTPPEPIITNTKATAVTEIPSYVYPPTYSGAPTHAASFPPAFANHVPVTVPGPPHLAGPPPGPPPSHITAPPGVPFASYIAPPPHYTPVATAPPFYQSTPAPLPSQPHRPYYPPPP